MVSGSAVVLLLITAVELAELFLSSTPRLVGFGRTAGTCRLGRLSAMATRGRPLQEVLRYGALQVLHGGGGSHAHNPGVFEGLAGR